MGKLFSLRPLTHIGAAVTDLDLDGPVVPEVADALYSAWLEHAVLVFPRTGISSDRQLALSRVFGELEIHPLPELRHKDNEQLAPFGTPEMKGPVFLVDGEQRAGYLFWHQDTAYTPNLCKGSMLRLITVPPQGGDTVFCDTAKAYNDLPHSMKQHLATLETLQCLRSVPPEQLWGMAGHSAFQMPDENGEVVPMKFREFPLVRHPMVVSHPESGRKALLLSPQGYIKILGMTQEDGDALFNEVVTHAVQDKYCYRHRWATNDLVLWDNRRTMHMAPGYPHATTRMGLRTTLKGPMPAGRIYVEEDQRAHA